MSIEQSKLASMLWGFVTSGLVIFFLFKMLTAIQFDDEFLLYTDKVGDVIANSVLPAECNA